MSLVVVQALGPISIQDLGRSGHMHEGVPPGGAAVPSRLVAANRAVGNHDDAPAIEVLGRLVVRDDHGAEQVIEAQTWAYVAVRGELARPLVTTQLHRGDRLACTPLYVVRADAPPIATVRVIPGPDREAFASIDALCSQPYEVAMPARTGAVLKGPPIPRVAGYRERSRPMVRGAIEVPAGGMPIVLGPDHPTTGGYPVLAVVASDDVERVFASRSVRFTT
jgi:allophanate hydrolase subunit 2